MTGRFFQEVDKKFLKFPEVETKLPIRADQGSAGYDFFTKCDIVLEPGKSILLPTDVKAYFPNNEVLKCYIRSSIGNKYHVKLKNGVGIIDSSFYGNPENGGNIHIPLHNYSNETFFLFVGERIMQGIFQPFFLVNDDEVLHQERISGFGSSNR